MCVYAYAHTHMGSILKLLIGDQEQEPDDDRIDGEHIFTLNWGAGT